ncbi:magnesium-translocating P-type ATPase [Mycobacteroides salmoniphilum]|uniref:magnesium-translocating P-type ATPase n=1 Tax=Mycobacteroides salmoniphilum TaxID=404941 RepID=UPI000991C6A9|nr:magnesium-translocating P-type ATPase [Mycobacteroides salmoniphilum]QCH24019.1 Magnesium-transporting ATPase, P-type 1 [Mycobacteroides salmoniphilum]
MSTGATTSSDTAAASLGIAAASALPVEQVLTQLAAGEDGLTQDEAHQRMLQHGPNAVYSHRARMAAVLWRQLRSPLLGLLVAAATVSFFVGERTDALVIGAIVALSVGLGFGNEYRAAKTAEALHSQIHHRALVVRDGHQVLVDVTELVPGDVLELRLGDIVPTDIRLLSVTELECDESVLTGESLPVEKNVGQSPVGAPLAELSGCALMGTVVHAGSGRGVVVATGAQAEFGRIAAGLDIHHPETQFQVGLRSFSMLLVQVAGVLTTFIFVVNLALHRPIIDALLFSLAIAVGITPQLLPAIVSTCLAAGSRRMSQRKVLVKRLVCIEDLGNVNVLFTDKTGTLTEGRISFMRALGPDGRLSDEALSWGLVCTEVHLEGTTVLGGNALDVALWESSQSARHRSEVAGYRVRAVIPFDHERRMSSVLVDDSAGRRTLVTKGAPETVLDRCADVPPQARAALAAEFAAGNRVVAVATRSATTLVTPSPDDERDLRFAGLLVFLDAPKLGAAAALQRLARLHIAVKIVTGDSPAVADKICQDLGLPVTGTLTGPDLDVLDDQQLGAVLENTTIFARVSPEDKARIVRVQRRSGFDVGFLGDGVNDALALHAADIGISVDSASDVAKDAADVILLEKDLDVLADGVMEGRRIFANTIKYILMGTSSNFGNMFSAAGASLFLSFLPMLPSQILLNNLLYDGSQLAIPTDEVDAEQLARPSRWNIGFIRRFMMYFGPISSLFDFATFGVMLWVFHSGPTQFRTGWFVESLATQALVIFAIRTRRIPFFRSTPSMPLVLSVLGVVVIGALLPATPLAHSLGFHPLPLGFFVALILMVVCYLILIEAGKKLFYSTAQTATRTPKPQDPRHHVQRRAARFSTALS